MTNRPVFIAAAISIALLAAQAAGAADSGKSFRWVDKNGVTHYGDSVPPEDASQGAAELNRQGVPLRKTPRQLTPDEAAAAQQEAADSAKRSQRDAFLLSTYRHVHDIEQLRDERVALIDGQMDIARGSITATDQKIIALQVRLRNFQPYSNSPNARRVPDQLAEEAVRALKDRRGLQETVAAREQEKTALHDQFDADIARFRELTSSEATR